MPEIALAKINPEAPLDGACLFACGLSTGLGAAMNTAKVEAGLDVRRLRRRHGRARRRDRLPPAGRRADRLRRPLRASASSSRRAHGATETMVGGPDAVERIVELTGGFGADYTFEATGNVARDAPGGRVGAHGLGPLHGRRRRRQGRDARHRAALPDHRPPRRRLVVRRRQGPRRRAEARRALARRRHRRRRRSSRTGSRSTRSTAASS